MHLPQLAGTGVSVGLFGPLMHQLALPWACRSTCAVQAFDFLVLDGLGVPHNMACCGL